MAKSEVHVNDIPKFRNGTCDYDTSILRDIFLEGLSKDFLILHRAIALKKMSVTRFAYAEDVLESFERSVFVLRFIVRSKEFESLFTCRTLARKQERTEKFVNVIIDDNFLKKVHHALKILRPMRRYLRYFDSDDARIHDDLPLTCELDHTLQQLDVNSFLTIDRNDELIKTFKKRKGETNYRRKHYVATMLDPCSGIQNVDPLMAKVIAHARAYCISNSTVENNQKDIILQFIDMLTHQFKFVWKE